MGQVWELEKLLYEECWGVKSKENISAQLIYHSAFISVGTTIALQENEVVYITLNIIIAIC